MQIYLIRHGEVEEKYHKVFGGSRIDMGLSALGRKHGEAVAAWLKDTKIDALYASPMLRVQQTLEPRLLYVNTPYKAQSQFPVYDTAAKDFNFVSIYTDNQFSGVDRVSDNHQLSFGAISRWVNPSQGGELLRLPLLLIRRLTRQPPFQYLGRNSD